MFSYDNTLGALLVGGLITIALWGVLSAQTFAYFQNRFKDSLKLKLLVAFLWCLSTFDACLVSYTLHYYLLTLSVNPSGRADTIWSLRARQAVTTVSLFLIRSMLIFRVYVLSERSITITTFLGLLSTVDASISLSIPFGSSVKHTNTGRLELALTKFFYASFAIGNTSDLALTGALCFFLYKSKTGIKSTNSIIDTLLAYIINTTLLCALDAVVVLILYANLPNNWTFLIFYLPLNNLYLNSYLALLNARDILRKRKPSVIDMSSALSSKEHIAAQPNSVIQINAEQTLPSSTTATTGTGLLEP